MTASRQDATEVSDSFLSQFPVRHALIGRTSRLTNTALHFHLAIPTEQSDIDYNDVEFSYTPLLDENRDADLLDILPDYLTEEITFPRSSAAKFYGKVVDCMTKRIIVEE